MGVVLHHHIAVSKANPYRDSQGRFASGGAGGGAGGDSNASGGSANEKKMNSALNSAKKNGANSEEIQSIKTAFTNKDENTLSDLEAGFAEAAAGRHGISVNEKGYTDLHTATVMALRQVTGTGKDEWPTLAEMENM